MRILPLLLLLAPLAACKYIEGRLATEKPALFDMEEPLALHEEPADETERRALAPGGFTGAYVADARQALEELDEEPEGILVERIVENSPAAAAGLEEGDLLLEADGKPLRWASEWRALELEGQPGEKKRLLYDRAGAERETVLELAARLRPADRGETERFREEDRVGVVVRTATEVEARAVGLGPGGGAVVVGLSRTSPWREAGLRFGDLIVAAGEAPVAHPNVLLRAIRDAPQDGAVKITFVRGGARQAIDAPLTRRATETKRVLVPLLYSYEKDRTMTRWSVFFAIYQHKRTPAAWETKLFWVFKWQGGDADRLEEVEE